MRRPPLPADFLIFCYFIWYNFFSVLTIKNTYVFTTLFFFYCLVKVVFEKMVGGGAQAAHGVNNYMTTLCFIESTISLALVGIAPPPSLRGKKMFFFGDANVFFNNKRVQNKEKKITE